MDAPDKPPHQRRKRYAGRHPRKFQDKYKEHGGDAETLQKVTAAGKTAAGTHRPIMVEEICGILRPGTNMRMVDCTLGYGGHAEALLRRMGPGGVLLGVDQDPAQLPLTEARMRELGMDEARLITRRSNFAGLPTILGELGWDGADGLLADLGVSSMQIDNPARGFSFKHDGPLDMRMNPGRGQTAAQLLAKATPEKLAALLRENADETHADLIARSLAGRRYESTKELARALAAVLPEQEVEGATRRTFQALRIAVNDEFAALESLLRVLPSCVKPGGRVAVLTFHSGEDRRVKRAFADGLREGVYAEISEVPMRPTMAEQTSNPRSSSAKLRWARRQDGGAAA